MCIGYLVYIKLFLFCLFFATYRYLILYWYEKATVELYFGQICITKVLQFLVDSFKLSENLRLLETTTQRKLSFALSKDESAKRNGVEEARPYDHDHG